MDDSYKICSRNYCIPNNYSITTRPLSKISGNPLEVTIRFSHLEVLEVNDVKFAVTLKMSLDVRWVEPRLVGPNFTDGNKIPLNLKLMEFLWLPDLDILNLDALQGFNLLTKMAGITKFATVMLKA